VGMLSVDVAVSTSGWPRDSARNRSESVASPHHFPEADLNEAAVAADASRVPGSGSLDAAEIG
jgi:hypothetical protein